MTVVGPLPLPVETEGQAATEPYQRALSFDQIDDGASGRSFFEDVPEGKLAILDTVSLRAEMPSGQIATGTVICQGAGLPSRFAIPLQPIGTFGGRSVYAATVPLRCYARGNGSIVGSIFRNSDVGATGEIAFSFSSHLEDLPLVD